MKKIVVALGISAMALLAACGGGGITPAADPLTSADPAKVAQLVQEYQAALSNTDPDITIPPLTRPAPTGKRLEIITCAVPICALYTQGAEEAAAALGWETKQLVAPFTPEGFKETWATVLQDRPDAVVMSAVAPTDTVIDQVRQASEQGIVVVGYGLDLPAGSGSPFTFGTTSPDALRVDGREQGLIVVNDARGAADVLIVTDPAQVVMKAQIEASSSVLESVGSTVEVLEVTASDIGRNVPTQIVTYLQAHPEVEYVVLPNDDFLSGVPQAIRSAGLEDVKLIGEAASNTSVDPLKRGELFASTVHPVLINGWYLVDAIARTMVGDPIEDANPRWVSAIVTKDNADGLGDLQRWPHIEEEFLTAWNVG